MTMIDIKNLTFGYDGSDVMLFDCVDLIIDTTWKLGLIGRNGRGKTTFLKILRGELHYGGRISGLPQFISFPFKVENEYDLGGDVIRNMAPNADDWEIKREMNYLELPEETLYKPYCILSGGEKTKLQLISLFLDEACFPLIDEPTNHLDSHGREVTANYLKRKKGFILISHDRNFLDISTDHTMAINKTNIEISPVSFSTWWEQNEIREKSEAAQNEKLKKDISRLKKAEEQVERWSNISESKKIGFDPKKTEKSVSRRSYEGAKAKKTMSLAKNMERRLDNKISEKSSLLKNHENREALKIEGQKHHSDLLIKAKDLVLYYDGTPICEPFSLEIRQGDKFSLKGTNGCGKTTFLRLITEGRLAKKDCLNKEGSNNHLTYSGEFMTASNLTSSLVRQDTSFLTGTPRDYCYELHIDEPRFKSILRKMGFSKDNLEQDMTSLSEGQKKCILIAGSLCEASNIYIWDEPLNYIDIYIRQTIEEMLLDADITMLFVEHDKTFTDRICNKSCDILGISY